MLPDHILRELDFPTQAEYTLWFSERVLGSLRKKLASVNESPKEQRASALDAMRDEIITDVTSLYKMVAVLQDTLVISEEDIATELERRSGNITGIYADGTPTQERTERKLAEIFTEADRMREHNCRRDRNLS